VDLDERRNRKVLAEIRKKRQQASRSLRYINESLERNRKRKHPAKHAETAALDSKRNQHQTGRRAEPETIQTGFGNDQGENKVPADNHVHRHPEFFPHLVLKVRKHC
jgi:hypothetical protein